MFGIARKMPAWNELQASARNARHQEPAKINGAPSSKTKLPIAAPAATSGFDRCARIHAADANGVWFDRAQRSDAPEAHVKEHASPLQSFIKPALVKIPQTNTARTRFPNDWRGPAGATDLEEMDTVCRRRRDEGRVRAASARWRRPLQGVDAARPGDRRSRGKMPRARARASDGSTPRGAGGGPGGTGGREPRPPPKDAARRQARRARGRWP